MPSRSLGHRAPLLWLALPFMAGLVAGKTGSLNAAGWPLVGAGICAFVAAWASWRAPRWFAPAIILAMIGAGAASFALHRPRIAAWDRLPPREAQLSLRITRIFPAATENRVSGIARIERAAEPLGEIVGQRVYFSLSRREGDPLALRSAVITARGVIASLPSAAATNTFDGYLLNVGVNFRLTRGRVLTEERAPSAYRHFCARAADRFSAILGLGVAAKRPALSGVLRAMLLGQQNELTEEQTELFRQSGTMHVFSISGLHIAVIAAGLHALLSLLRLPRMPRFLLGAATLWLYVDITGGAPSAVRAFVMVALVQAAFVLRLPRNPLSALAASMLLVLLIDPLQVFNASFQMSYGIVASLLLLGLPLADRWQARFTLFRDLPKVSWRWWQHGADAAWRALLGALAISVSASLVSAITGVLFFNLFTPGALLANLWLIPAASLVILFGFISLLGGLVGLTAVSVLGNHAAVLLLLGVDRTIAGFVTLPAMWLPAEFRASWIGPTALAIVLATLLAGYASRWRGWARFYWAPPLVVGVALLAGTRFG